MRGLALPARLRTPTRPLAAVPRWLAAAFALALAGQLGWYAVFGRVEAAREALPEAPPEAVLRLAALGEPAVLARAGTLWLQFFDQQAGASIPFRELDYTRVREWLARWLALAPASDYPLLLAVRVYGRVSDPARRRIMFDFVHAAFRERPALRWRWLAEAALLARHRLEDPDRALRYARDLAEHTPRDTLPEWARDLRIPILEDMGRREAARMLIRGLLSSGDVTDPRERAFLRRRLEALSPGGSDRDDAR